MTAVSPNRILLAKSETAGNTTADWSDRGSFATSVRSSDDFASSIESAGEPVPHHRLLVKNPLAVY